MKKIQFIFGIHNHQPVGNFDEVFQHACDRSYLPFLQILEKFPGISMALHFSGSLIEWLEKKSPDVLDLLGKLVRRGNIEVLGAGFYEPILAMIPAKDQVGQIRKMTAWVRQRFDVSVRGNWLTERVWEPHLVSSFARAHIDYIVVDDYHFLSSGIYPEDLNGYYQTEHEGDVLGVFPISQDLRYAIPFEDPQVTIDILRSQADESGDRVLVMADDGEKFGIWPGTWDTVYGQRWLERFFQLLEENSDWLTTTTFRRYFQEHGPRDLVYLPTSSYFEMSQWTLPTRLGQQLDHLVHDLQNEGRGALSRPFIKGGMWRNFFTKYPDSNWMQKRMQFLSLSLNEGYPAGDIPSALLDDLYRAQCNCGYWHGIFGGLYLPHLRHALYEHILKAETAFVAAGGVFPGKADLDADGVAEYRLRSDVLQIFLTADQGHIREMDWLPANFNLTNYIQRYSESYHEKLAQANGEQPGGGSIHDQVLTKEANLQDKLFIDSYAWQGLIDHFFNQGQTQGNYYRGELHSDFVSNTTSVEQAEAGVLIRSKGQLNGTALTLEKNLALHHDTLTITVRISNNGTQSLNGYYGLEFNFGLLGGNSPDRYYLLNDQSAGPLNTQGADTVVQSLSLVNEWDKFKIHLAFEPKCHLWRAPLETVSMSEAGFERVYQASSVLPHWLLNLAAGQGFTAVTVLRVNNY